MNEEDKERKREAFKKNLKKQLEAELQAELQAEYQRKLEAEYQRKLAEFEENLDADGANAHVDAELNNSTESGGSDQATIGEFYPENVISQAVVLPANSQDTTVQVSNQKNSV